jgi:hypothetical protein
MLGMCIPGHHVALKSVGLLAVVFGMRLPTKNLSYPHPGPLAHYFRCLVLIVHVGGRPFSLRFLSRFSFSVRTRLTKEATASQASPNCSTVSIVGQGVFCIRASFSLSHSSHTKSVCSTIVPFPTVPAAVVLLLADSVEKRRETSMSGEDLRAVEVEFPVLPTQLRFHSRCQSPRPRPVFRLLPTFLPFLE